MINIHPDCELRGNPVVGSHHSREGGNPDSLDAPRMPQMNVAFRVVVQLAEAQANSGGLGSANRGDCAHIGKTATVARPPSRNPS